MEKSTFLIYDKYDLSNTHILIAKDMESACRYLVENKYDYIRSRIGSSYEYQNQDQGITRLMFEQASKEEQVRMLVDSLLVSKIDPIEVE